MALGEEIKGLSDVDAIRLIQQREGSTPCYGRDVALRPGADGVCLIEGCCWRHFCSAYQSNAAPIDGALHYLTPDFSHSDGLMRAGAVMMAQVSFDGHRLDVAGFSGPWEARSSERIGSSSLGHRLV